MANNSTKKEKNLDKTMQKSIQIKNLKKTFLVNKNTRKLK